MKYKLGNVTIYVVVKDQMLSMVNLSGPPSSKPQEGYIYVYVYKLCFLMRNPQKKMQGEFSEQVELGEIWQSKCCVYKKNSPSC